MSSRILYLVGCLRPGGLERQLYLLLEGLDRERYRPELVVWKFREDEPYVRPIRALGVPIHKFPPTLSRPAKVRVFRRLVSRIRPEVVHSYSFPTNIAAWWAAVGTKSVAIGSVQGELASEKKMAGPVNGRLSAAWPRQQIFNSSRAAQAAERWRGPFVPARIMVVHNGLDFRCFRATPLTGAGRVCVVGVGSLFAVKRWDRLFAAAAQLMRSGYDFEVRIVGDGPLRGELQRKAEVFGVADRVELVGHSDDVSSVLAGATFLVHTSDSEGRPNVVMEAMACGRAVIATDVGDVPLLIEEGRTGFVVPREDHATLVARMANLIRDRALCRHMGEMGRVKAEREFSVDGLVSNTLAAYRTAGWMDSEPKLRESNLQGSRIEPEHILAEARDVST